MKKYYPTFPLRLCKVLLSFLILSNVLAAQTYSTSAPINSYQPCSSGGDLTSFCPANPTTYFDNTIKSGVRSQSGASFTLRVTTCNNQFSGSGTLFIKEGGVCGSNLPGLQQSVSAGTNFVEVLYTATHTSGDVELWAVFDSDASGQRFYAEPIVITATLPDPEIEVTSNQATVEVGCTTFIQWDTDNISSGTVDIKLYDVSNQFLATLRTGLNVNASGFSWTIGNDANGNYIEGFDDATYRIRAELYNNNGDFEDADFGNAFFVREPTLNITSPDFETYVSNGDVLPIRWDRDDFCGALRVEIYRSNSNTPTIATSSTNNQTGYDWTVNGLSDGSYRVVIFRATNGTATSYPSAQSSFFTVGPPVPSLAVDALPGISYRGCERTVSWSSSNITGDVTLELARANGTDGLLVIAENVAGNGNVNWEVGRDDRNGSFPTSITPGSYRFKIYDDGGLVRYSSSFTIADPAITIIESPVDGSFYDIDQPLTVDWETTATYCGPISAELIPETGGAADILFDGVSNQSPRSVSLDGVAPGNYRLKLYRPIDSGSTPAELTSGVFTIGIPGSSVLQLREVITTNPDPLVSGQPGRIRAYVENVGNAPYNGTLSFQLRQLPSGSPVELITNPVVNIQPGASNAYPLERPFDTGNINSPAGDYEVIVRATNSGGGFDLVGNGGGANPQPVEITAIPPKVTLLSPQSGSVAWGQNFPPFTYSMTGNVTGVNVELIHVLTNSIYSIAEDANPTGNFSGYTIDYCWIPGDYRLKIYPTNNQTSSGADISEGLFTINGTTSHSFTLNAPGGGQTFLAGEPLGDILWTSVGIAANAEVTLELARPDGGPAAVRDTFANGIPNNGSFSDAVLSQNLPTGQYVVKIYTSHCGPFGTVGSVSALSEIFTVESNYDGDCDNCVGAVDGDPESREAVNFLCSNCIIQPRPGGDYFLDEVIPKEDVANIAFGGLFQDAPDGPNTLTYADDFPTPFLDLQASTQPYQRYGRVLSYLEYGDGIAPFTRRNPNYNAGSSITRGQICKVYCETFNIPLDVAFEPFSDVTASHPEQRYIAKLFELGVVKAGNGQFRPNDPVTRREAFLMLYRLMDDCLGCLDNKLTNPLDTMAFYDPGNYTPYNLGRHPSLSDGNFDSYSATGLYLADRGMPLVFSHSYNSYLTELPAGLFPVEPLGRGWSHSFHAYIQKIPAAELSPNHSGPDLGEVLAVVWPGGSMHYYRDNSSLDKITVGNFDEINFANDEYTITKKNQLQFVFARTQVQGEDTYWLKSIRDRNGNAVSLTYEAFTRSIDNGDGTTGTDVRSRLRIVSGTTGRHFQLSYNHTGQPDKISQVLDHSLGRTLQFGYGGGENRLKQYFDAESKLTDYTYSTAAGEDDLLKVVTLPNGNFMTNTYVDGKLRSSQTNTASGGRAQEVDVNWSLQGSGGTSSTMKVDDGTNIREYSYVTNALGKIESIETAGNDAEVEYGTGNYATLPVRIRVKNGTRTLETEYVYSTDGKGNVKEVHQEEGVNHFFTYTSLNDVETYENPRGFTTTFGYFNGNLTSVQAPIGTTTMGYDNYGQVDWVQNPEGIRIEYDYDPHGNVEEMRAPLGLTSTAMYDAGSRLKEFTNPKNQRTSYEYDKRNLTEKVTRHMLYPTTLDIETAYGFDDNGNLRTITNANDGVTEMEYNYFDWLESEQFGSAVREYDYYEDGKLKKITRADNTTLDFTYFETNNLLQNDGYATYSYDNLNRLKTVSKDNKAITYFYDDLNRITAIDYDGHTVGYDYDPNSNVINIDYGVNGIDVDYTYDENDRLETVTDWLGNVTTYHYLNDGRLTYVSLPNGTRTEYYYDGAGRMDSLVNLTNGGTVICAYGFSLDNLGNHVQERKTEPYGVFNYQNGEETGQYDARNQVQQYDDVQFTHDQNGNIKSMAGGWNISNIEWDKHDMPTAFTGTDFNSNYSYDGLGHRRAATRNSVTTEYGLDILGMSRVLFEADENGNPTCFYVHGMGMISRIKAEDDTERYFHYDFRGSTIAMTDENATITHQYQYDAFGRTLQLQEEDINRFRFVGGFGVMQENERMLFMRARYYDTDMGRFFSEDPVWGENLYGYAGNDPINKTDPKGENPVDDIIMAIPAFYDTYRAANKSTKSGFYTFDMYKASNRLMDAPLDDRDEQSEAFSDAFDASIGLMPGNGIKLGHTMYGIYLLGIATDNIETNRVARYSEFASSMRKDLGKDPDWTYGEYLKSKTDKLARVIVDFSHDQFVPAVHSLKPALKGSVEAYHKMVEKAITNINGPMVCKMR